MWNRWRSALIWQSGSRDTDVAELMSSSAISSTLIGCYIAMQFFKTSYHHNCLKLFQLLLLLFFIVICLPIAFELLNKGDLFSLNCHRVVFFVYLISCRRPDVLIITLRLFTPTPWEILWTGIDFSLSARPPLTAAVSWRRQHQSMRKRLLPRESNAGSGEVGETEEGGCLGAKGLAGD